MFFLVRGTVSDPSFEENYDRWRTGHVSTSGPRGYRRSRGLMFVSRDEVWVTWAPLVTWFTSVQHRVRNYERGRGECRTPLICIISRNAIGNAFVIE